MIERGNSSSAAFCTFAASIFAPKAIKSNTLVAINLISIRLFLLTASTSLTIHDCCRDISRVINEKCLITGILTQFISTTISKARFGLIIEIAQFY